MQTYLALPHGCALKLGEWNCKSSNVEAKVSPQAPATAGIHHAATFTLYACAGRREWPAFRDWFADSLTPALNAWMGSVEVVYEGRQALDPERRYVFGYAPHGLFPIGVHRCSCAPTRACWPLLMYMWVCSILK